MSNHGATQGPTAPRLFKEIFKPEWIEVPVDRIVEREVRVEVPVEKIVERIVRVEVPVEKIVKVKHIEYVIPPFWEYVKILLKRLRDAF